MPGEEKQGGQAGKTDLEGPTNGATGAPLPSRASEESFRLVEYQSLRSETLQSQQTRITIVGVTVAAFGVISGIAFNDPSQVERVSALAGAEFLFLLAAVEVTVVLTHRILVLASYIRAVPESAFGGGWETALRRERKSKEAGKSGVPTWIRELGQPPLNTSRALALIYTVVVVAVDAIYCVAAVTVPFSAGDALLAPIMQQGERPGLSRGAFAAA